MTDLFHPGAVDSNPPSPEIQSLKTRKKAGKDPSRSENPPMGVNHNYFTRRIL